MQPSDGAVGGRGAGGRCRPRCHTEHGSGLQCGPRNGQWHTELMPDVAALLRTAKCKHCHNIVCGAIESGQFLTPLCANYAGGDSERGANELSYHGAITHAPVNAAFTPQCAKLAPCFADCGCWQRRRCKQTGTRTWRLRCPSSMMCASQMWTRCAIWTRSLGACGAVRTGCMHVGPANKADASHFPGMSCLQPFIYS